MSRSYKGIRPKRHRVYSGEDLQHLYGVSKNTVSNWVKAGLLPSDRERPYLFRGARVEAFHRACQARAKSSLLPGEFKCFSCKSAVLADESSVAEKPASSGASMLWGRCAECGGSIHKIASRADLEFFHGNANPNATPDSPHEENHSPPGGIGISEYDGQSAWITINDRVMYGWQAFAGKYDPKTVDRHLSAIREFEVFLNGKRFGSLTVSDASGFRDQLKDAMSSKGPDQRSKSTVSHVASHVSAFLRWLLKQAGYRRLPSDLPDYLHLPKAAYAQAVQRPRREYSTLEDAAQILCAMPSRTLNDRRARAIFALAFLGALRADTLISLRLGDVNCEAQTIRQDASAVRTKNGKSDRTGWFPIATCFGDEVRSWVKLMQEKGLRPTDALFPNANLLGSPRRLRDPLRDPIEPMASKHAVTEAFKTACAPTGAHYTPHSARHSLAAERDNRSLTHRQRRAWSEKMGHESEQITERHYGKLPEAERLELIQSEPAERVPDVREMTDKEKVQLVDAIFAKFKSGSVGR